MPSMSSSKEKPWKPRNSWTSGRARRRCARRWWRCASGRAGRRSQREAVSPAGPLASGRLVEADHGLGVADVDGQQHQHPPSRSQCRSPSATPTSMLAATRARKSLAGSRTSAVAAVGQARCTATTSRPMSSTGAEMVSDPDRHQVDADLGEGAHVLQGDPTGHLDQRAATAGGRGVVLDQGHRLPGLLGVHVVEQQGVGAGVERLARPGPGCRTRRARCGPANAPRARATASADAHQRRGGCP